MPSLRANIPANHIFGNGLAVAPALNTPRIGTCRLAGERRQRGIIGGSDKTPGQRGAAERAVDGPHNHTIAAAGALALAKFDVLGSDYDIRISGHPQGS